MSLLKELAAYAAATIETAVPKGAWFKKLSRTEQQQYLKDHKGRKKANSILDRKNSVKKHLKSLGFKSGEKSVNHESPYGESRKYIDQEHKTEDKGGIKAKSVIKHLKGLGYKSLPVNGGKGFISADEDDNARHSVVVHHKNGETHVSESHEHRA